MIGSRVEELGRQFKARTINEEDLETYGATCLIDAKVDIPFWKERAMKTVEGTLNRIRIAKSQNPGIRVIYEFPKKEAAQKMNNWLNNNPDFKRKGG